MKKTPLANRYKMRICFPLATLLGIFLTLTCSALDSDLDGIDDGDDQWPSDPTKPITSDLWGAYGETWFSQSRLPFYGFAGYHDGKDPLPTVTRVVADVTTYGADGSDANDDTQAFRDAITAAGSLVSATNHGVIRVPAGTYYLSDKIILDTSGMVLQGEGRDTTKLVFSNGIKTSGHFVELGTGGYNWKFSQWDTALCAKLDYSNLSKRGDFSIRLGQTIPGTFAQNLANQGHRVALTQYVDWTGSDNGGTSTPKIATEIFGGPQLLEAGSGKQLISQEFIVSVDPDNQTLHLDRPLRFSPTDEPVWTERALICLRNPADFGSEEIGVEYLTVEMDGAAFVGHNGVGQEGISINACNSWVRGVRIINGDNSIQTAYRSSNNEIADLVLDSTRPGQSYGPGRPEKYKWYKIHGHAGITCQGYDHVVRDFEINKSFIHDLYSKHTHGCVYMRGEGMETNFDFHRQTVYGNLFCEIKVGAPHRLYNATGDGPEGHQNCAYNTWWNITSNDPAYAHWPGDGWWMVPMWGYYVANFVGTDLLGKPRANRIARNGSIGLLYHPEDAHLEVIPQDLLWPPNLYEAQRNAFQAGGLWNVNAAPVNNPPVAYSNHVETDQNTALGIVLAGNDLEHETLAFHLVSQPLHGSLAGAAPNLTYTPQSGFNGMDCVEFEVTDGTSTSETAKVCLLVGDLDSADHDRDGQSDGMEWEHNTDPHDAGSRFDLAGFGTVGTDDVLITWPSSYRGKQYRVWASGDLSPSSWVVVQDWRDSLGDTEATAELTRTAPRRFFKVESKDADDRQP